MLSVVVLRVNFEIRISLEIMNGIEYPFVWIDAFVLLLRQIFVFELNLFRHLLNDLFIEVRNQLLTELQNQMTDHFLLLSAAT